MRTKARDDGSLRGGEHAGLIAVTKLDKRAFEPCLSHPEEKWKWSETVGERSDTSGEASAERPVYEESCLALRRICRSNGNSKRSCRTVFRSEVAINDDLGQ